MGEATAARPRAGWAWLRGMSLTTAASRPLLGLLVFLLGTVAPAWAGSGIYGSYAIVNSTYRQLDASSGGFGNFNAANLGTFAPNGTLVLNGGELKTFKNSGDNILQPTLSYRIYATGQTPGAFQSFNLNFNCEFGGACPGGNSADLNGAGDQKWITNNAAINLLSGLPTGSYSIDVRESAPFTFTGGGGGSGTYNTAIATATFTIAAPATSLINEGFEGANSFTVVNGTATNKWITGTGAGAASGANAAYISNAGTTYAYTNTATSTVFLYRDVTIPAGETAINLSFAWKGNGESTYDYLRVAYTAPATYTPTASATTNIRSTTIPLAPGVTDLFNNLGQQSVPAFTNASMALPNSLAGTTVRLIFMWSNDGSGGTAPPAALDNVVLTSAVPVLLTGAYTIDQTLATAGRNFQTWAAAISALNNGISGPVTFTVTQGQTFSEAPQTITATGTAANTITFAKSSGGNNPVLQGTTGIGTADASLTLSGSDYITFTGIDFRDNSANATAAARMEYGLFLNAPTSTNGCQNITVQSSNISFPATNTGSTSGVYSSSAASSAAGANSNLLFQNVAVSNALIGYNLNGVTAFPDNNNQITGTAVLPAALTSTITGLATTASTPIGVSYTNQTSFLLSNTALSSFVSTGGSAYGVASTTGSASTATISGNTFNNISTSVGSVFVAGVYVTSATSTAVTGNTFANLSASAASTSLYGVAIGTSASAGTATITGNTISNLSLTSATANSAALNAVQHAPVTGSTVSISRNTIFTVSNATTSSTAVTSGISINNGSTSQTTTVNISNNLISDIKANASTSTGAGVRGIDFRQNLTYNVFHNTVYFNGMTATAVAHTSGAFYMGAPPVAVDFRNNIFVNKYGQASGATGRAVAIYRTATTTFTPTTINNNLLFGTTGLYYDGTTNQTTLAGYRTALGSPRETNAVTESTTPFISNTNPHLDPTTSSPVATVAESGGVAGTGIVDDIDATGVRTGYPKGSQANGGGTAPDIGADEGDFKPAPLMTVSSTQYTQNNANTALGATNQQVTGVIVNTVGSVNPLTLTSITFSLNGTAPANVSNAKLYSSPTATFSLGTATLLASTGTIASSYTLTLTTPPTLATGANYFFLTYDIPAGATAGQTVQSTVTTVTTSAGGTTPTLSGAAGSRTIVGPLAGTYTVGQPTGAVPSPSYATITAAIADLNLRGVSAAVVFSLINPAATPYNTANNESFPLNLTAYTGTSAANTVTFKPALLTSPLIVNAGTTSTFVVTSAANYVLDGSNTVGGISRDLTISNTSPTATSAALVYVASTIAAPSSNIQVRNLVLQGAVNTGTSPAISVGILVSSTSYNISTGGSANGIVIANNAVQGTGGGIVVGNDPTTPGTGLQITDNVVGPAGTFLATNANNIGQLGIFVQQATSPSVTGNTVQNVGIATATATPFGMSFATGVTGATVSGNTINGVYVPAGSFDAVGLLLGANFTGGLVDRNKVLNVVSNTSTYSGQGIRVTTATATSNLQISNNFVAGITGAGWSSLTSDAIYGIGLQGTTGGVRLYHNSVNLTGTYSPVNTSTYISAAFFAASGTSALDVRDNIFVNSLVNTGSSSKAYALYSSAAKAAFTTINYNDYYVSGIQGVLAFFASADRATLATLQDGTTGTGQDANSVNGDPQFTSATDLHILPTTATKVESAGVLIAAAGNDVDNQARGPYPLAGQTNGGGFAPDLGADEGNFTPTRDVGITALTAPSSGSSCFSATETVTVTLKNFGGTTLNFATNPVTVSGTVTGPTTTTLTPVVINTGTLGAGATQPVTFVTTANMSLAGTYTFNISASLSGDADATNDALPSTPAGTNTRTQVRPNAPTLTPSSAAICAGSSTVVVASTNTNTLTNQTALATATFDNGADGFTVTTNAGNTGGTEFTRVTAPYTNSNGPGNYNGPSGSATGGFYIANSNTTGATSNSQLISPAFSTVNYTAATLSFQQYYLKYTAGDVAAALEYSTNGTNWTLLVDYLTAGSQGTSTGTQIPTTVSLPAGALGQATVQVRFRYQSTFGFYWAIDNVGVTGSRPESATFAVVGNPTTAVVAGNNITFNPTTTTTYNVTASFPSNSCPSAATPITITVNPLPTATLSATSPVCAGSPSTLSGTLTGNGPWSLTYAIDGANQAPMALGATGNTTFNYSFASAALAAGTRSITITALTDATCTATSFPSAASVTVNPLPTATLAATSPICSGTSTTLSGNLTGTGPWNITYTANGVTQPVATAATSPFSITPAAITANTTYAITALSDANCTATSFPASVAVTVRPLPTFSTTQANVSCNGNGDGSITVTAAGGTAPYEYSIDNGTTYVASATNPYTFTGLAPATYQVLVKGQFCTAATAQPVTITQPALLVASATPTNATCANGNNGSILASATGGTPAYGYRLGTSGLYSNTTGSFTGLAPGTYTIGVKDANNCTASTTATVGSNNAAPTATLSATSPICSGTATTLSGNLTGSGPWSITYTANGLNPVTVSGIATSPFSITPAAITANTTYAITALSDARCTATSFPAPVAVTVNPRPTATASNDGPFCNGGAGNVTFVFAGTGPWNYTYTYTGAVAPVSGTSTSGTLVIPTGLLLANTTYTLTALSDANCAATANPVASTTVVVSSPPSFTTMQTNVGCFGNSTGSITVSATGGVAPYNYSKDGGATYQFSNLFNNLAAGSYQIVVRNNAGAQCAAPAQTVVISQPATAVMVTASKTDVTCNGGSDGSITATGSNGTGPYQYSIDSGNTYVPTVATALPYTFMSLPAGTYTILVRDANACTASTGTILVSINPRPTATLTNSGVQCAGNTATITVNLTGQAPWNLTYTDGTTSTTVTNILTSPYTFVTPILTANTTYTVTALNDAFCSGSGSGLGSTTVPVNVSSTWTGGASSTNWFDALNWTNCVPNRFVNAVIPGSVATYPNLVGPGTAEVKTLTLSAGGALKLSAGELAVYGNFSSSGNADLVVPTATPGVVTGGTLSFNGPGIHQLSGISEVYNFVVNTVSTTTTTLLSALRVDNQLTMNSGKLNTGTFSIELASADQTQTYGTATIVETETSYVLGKVYTSHNVSTAGSPDSFGGLGLTLTPAVASASLPGTTLLTRSTGTYVTGTGTSQSILRQYRVVPTVDVNLNVGMAFQYFTHELNGIAPANLELFSAAIPAGGGASSGPWSYYTASTVASTPTGGNAGTVTLASVNHLSDWTLGNRLNPLPVTLTRFEATRRDADAELTWATASEKNNAGFEVQVSTDGRAFRTLHTVEPASANSSAPRSYGYTDREAGKAGLRYYRLRQLDLDGTATTSQVRTVAFEKAAAASLSAAPNPFSSALTLTVTNPTAATDAPLTLTDAAGRTVLTQRLALPTGTSPVALTGLDPLPAGVYLLHLPLNGSTLHLKVVKE